MRVLVYKRTHEGDPSPESGLFGCNGCMGRVRGMKYDAVIGVGGTGPKARASGIAGKITWIGIGPHFVKVPDERGPGVLFDHFEHYGQKGEQFRKSAPKLARRMYGRKIRVVLNSLTAAESAEVEAIVKWAARAPASPHLAALLRPPAAVAKARPTPRRKSVC